MKIIASLIAASVLFISAPSAGAEFVCGPRESAVRALENQFKEKVFGRGLAANGHRMIELFVSETGSWTMLDTDPDGLSCITVEGESWQGIKVLVGEPV